MKWWRRLAVVATASGSLLLTGGLWLPAKAALAQVMLRHAWAETEGAPVKPWPWARTWPVARLEVPALGVEEIVLAGDEGAALAFAPGHVDGTAAPGESGNTVLAGHRDTVFAFLDRLGVGDELIVESSDGGRHRYSVASTHVVHERDLWALEPTIEPVLTLVTCYPLDGTRPNGPMRYVVRAVVRSPSTAAREPSAANEPIRG